MSDFNPLDSGGISEVDLWKSRYLAARKETKTLADALEFIRDCEDVFAEGVTVSVTFLKEQARAILHEVQP